MYVLKEILGEPKKFIFLDSLWFKKYNKYEQHLIKEFFSLLVLIYNKHKANIFFKMVNSIINMIWLVITPTAFVAIYARIVAMYVLESQKIIKRYNN